MIRWRSASAAIQDRGLWHGRKQAGETVAKRRLGQPPFDFCSRSIYIKINNSQTIPK